MNTENEIKVSIVIVCMNNLKNLYPCLESIKKYTHVSYETFVVAYLFTPENLQKVRTDFPWVTFVESNEIRGFSENNNLALKQAKGEYCFVLNDDTEIRMPTIDGLVGTMEALPNKVAIVSPLLVRYNGEVQYAGKSDIGWKEYVKIALHIWKDDENRVKSNKPYQTYNIIGAAFLIKRNVFEEMGWFDERYFFCPEDMALATKLNKNGYECYVSPEHSVIHFEGMSGKSLSLVQTATKPAQRKGGLIFYSQGRKSLYLFLAVFDFTLSLCACLYNYVKSLLAKRPNYSQVLALGYWNTVMTILTKKTPKEIFAKYYLRIRK